MNKKILLFFFIVLLYNGFIFPQWSTDPNNNLIVGYGLDPNICSDSAGGCYITYDYDNLSYPRKLALERINRYGYKPWGTKKQILGVLPEQWQAEIIEDGEGGVIVSYQDNEWIPPAYFNSKVRVQKVDSSGNFLWGQSGIRVTLTEINQGSNQQVSDGEGGCIIVWQDYDGKYWLNRINRFGQRVWTDSGKVLGISAYSEKPRILKAADGNYFAETGEYIYRIRPNGEIILWESTIEWGLITATPDGGGILHSSIWNPSFYKLIAQRKDTLGNNIWQEPYVEIGDSLYINTQLRIQNSGGYYYYGWNGTKNGINRISQFQVLREDGSKLFPSGSIQISENTPLGSPYIIPSDSDHTILIWNDGTTTSTTIAQMYDTLGNKLWNENGIVVSYPAITVQTVTDGQGGFITCGPINQFTIAVQQVSRGGNLGEVLPVPVELVSFTGTVDEDKVKLNWITSTELNNYGFEIERTSPFPPPYEGGGGEAGGGWSSIGFVEGHGTTTETQSYSFIDKDLLSGKVKYRLKQIDFDGTYEYSKEIEVEVDLTPKEFVLHQNYPNPFNPTTKIKYEIPQTETENPLQGGGRGGLVTLKVFDILGNEVTTLVNEAKPSGIYEVEFSDVGLASGVYFYQLKAGDLPDGKAGFISTKKMTLIK